MKKTMTASRQRLRQSCLQWISSMGVGVFLTVVSTAASPQPSANSISTVNNVKIVSSLPMTGGDPSQAQSIVNSIQMALEQRNSTVCNGKLKVSYQIYDDATAATGKWDPAQVISNSNTIVADSGVVGVIGTFNSGAAKLAIPIFNPSNLVIISPANTYPGLTKPGKGEENEPDTYYPNGKRNYARVIPADDLQGAVAAQWTKALGAQKVYILDDQELYGKTIIAGSYEQSAKKIGLKILGHESIDPGASDYRALMDQIKALQPDLIYYGGITRNNAGQLLKDMHNAGMTEVKFMGPDGIFEQALIDAAGRDAEGVYITSTAFPPSVLSGQGQKWYSAYKAKFNSEPDPYAIYGYDAAQILLNAIDRVCKPDRDTIRQTVLATKNFPGLLDSFSLDANGDTTSTIMSGNQVKDGRWYYLQRLQAQQ